MGLASNEIFCSQAIHHQASTSGKLAVKVINYYGDEVLKVLEVFLAACLVGCCLPVVILCFGFTRQRQTL